MVVVEVSGEAVVEVGQRGVAVDNNDAGVAADVTESLVVWTGNYMAAVAAHKPKLCRRQRIGVEGAVFPGEGGEINGFRIQRRRWGGGSGWRRSGEWWGLHRRS